MLTSFKENAFYTDKFSKTKPQILLNRGGGGAPGAPALVSAFGWPNMEPTCLSNVRPKSKITLGQYRQTTSGRYI